MVWDNKGADSGWIEYNDPADPDGDGKPRTFTTSSPPPDPSFECSLDKADWKSVCNDLGSTIDETVYFRNQNAGYDSYKWDFDYDGSFNSTPPHESEVEHTFTKAGTYTVMHQVRDDGLTCQESPTLDIYRQLPEWREIPPT